MCVCVCVYKYIIYTVYVYIYVYVWLEISDIASSNVNHFWGNWESLSQSDSPNFFSTVNHFWSIANHFSNGIAQRPFFFVLTPFFRQNFPVFRQILCIRCKNVNKLQIMIRNCEALLK